MSLQEPHIVRLPVGDDPPSATLYYGRDVREVLSRMPSGSVHTICTSPPYWGLRNYGTLPLVFGGRKGCAHRWGDDLKAPRRGAPGSKTTLEGTQRATESKKAVGQGAFCLECGAWKGDLGLEPSPKMYVEHMVEVFREVHRVLRDDGTLWLNIGDTYWGGGSTTQRSQDPDAYADKSTLTSAHRGGTGRPVKPQRHETLKPKDLVGIPWRLAIALQDDGWWLRNDIIWSKCLGGTTRVYARTPAGDGPRMIKDLFRSYQPDQVQLWTGEKWSKVVAWEKTPSRPTVRLDFRCGDRIYCSPEHRWPTTNGIKEATNLEIGDVVASTRLPEPDAPTTPVGLPDVDIGWFVGLYLAEGSRSGDVLQFAGHRKEMARHVRLKRIADAYHGTCNRHKGNGKGVTDNIRNPVLDGVIRLYVGGRTAHTKFLTEKVWRRSDEFLQALLEGYLEGDGHWDDANNRWRLGFRRNRTMERQFRTLTARLGHHLKLVPNHATYTDSKTRKRKKVESYRGEIRFERSGHHNEKESWEVVGVATSTRSRALYDIQIEDAPHLFALASGVLTHNSNPLPHPAKDRMSCSHEHIFLLTKARRYYFNLDAIRVPHTYGEYDEDGEFAPAQQWPSEGGRTDRKLDQTKNQLGTFAGPPRRIQRGLYNAKGRNPGDVWVFPTQPFPGAHFACVDEETDCLTIEGWKHHSEIKPGMFAAQYDMATGRLSWAPVEAVARYEVVDQMMISADTRDLSIRLTPNHRTLISRRGSRNRARKPPIIVEASDLKKSHAIPVSAPWNDYGESPFSPEWAELIGWYMAEGNEKSAVTVEIHQSRSANAPKVARIRHLLDSVDAIYEVAEANRVWRGRPNHMAAFQIRGFAAVRLRQFVTGKKLAVKILRWSKPLREALFRGLIDGDGHRRQDDARQSFIQRDGEMAGLVQALGFTLGYAAHMTVKGGCSTSFFTEKKCIGLAGTGAGGLGPTRVNYTGTVWCPKLPAGTWVARRKGRAFITGNTFPPALPERCILAGTSDKGVCPSCSTPWALVKDSRAKDPSRKGGNVLAEEWKPACDCGIDRAARSVVMDPFSGSGTTGLVALELGRDYIGIDLNEGYLKMASARVIGDKPPEEPLPVEEGSVLDLFGTG